eukprot:SAG31_NODE_664_length_12996_cov_4.853997_1_plen_88_part_00
MVRVANPHNAGRSMWDVMNPSRQDGAANAAARAKDDPYDMVAALERVSNQLGGGALSRHMLPRVATTETAAVCLLRFLWFLRCRKRR